MLPVIVLTLLGIVFIHLVYLISQEDIETNIKKSALAGINKVISVQYDNDIFNEFKSIDVPVSLNSNGSLSVYQARRGQSVVALAMLPVETRGYSGPIKLIVGLTVDGQISGLYVLSHKETPGFGAQLHQDKSDWLMIFQDASLETYKKPDWATKKDGGQFDQLSGATITSRAVINVVHDLLEYYARHPEKFTSQQDK